MTIIRTRIVVSPDGDISGKAPPGLPAGEHNADIAVGEGSGRLDLAEVTARVRAIQDRVAALPVLDTRTDDEILGYNETGAFD